VPETATVEEPEKDRVHDRLLHARVVFRRSGQRYCLCNADWRPLVVVELCVGALRDALYRRLTQKNPRTHRVTGMFFRSIRICLFGESPGVRCLRTRELNKFARIPLLIFNIIKMRAASKNVGVHHR